jgi:hypothetical protein
MLSFREFLLEGSKGSIFDPTQKYEHSTHASSLHVLEGQAGGDHFLRMANEIINHVNTQNKVPDHVRTKFDGAPAIFATSNSIAKKGNKKAEKHSAIRSIWNRSTQALRNVMHSALKHISPLIPHGIEVMGDIMHMGGTTRTAKGRLREADRSRQAKEDSSGVSFHPNTLRYTYTDPAAKRRAMSSHIGFVPHTTIRDGKTRPISRSEFDAIDAKGKERNVDVISPFIDHNVSFTHEENRLLAHHMAEYDKIHRAHNYGATDHHSEMFEQYLNSGIWSDKPHTYNVSGYKEFLTQKIENHSDKKVRTLATANHTLADEHAPHLENHIRMFNHAREVASIVNEALSRGHPIRTTHDGKPIPHEGVVSSMPLAGSKEHGPVIKFVNRRRRDEGGFSGINKSTGQMQMAKQNPT